LPSLGSAVSEEFLTFVAEKASSDGYVVVAFLEDETAGDEAGSPLIFFGAALLAISGDIFLRDSIDDGTDSGPDAGAGTHGAGLVGGVEDEFGEVAAIAAGDVLERFQFDMLDAGTGSLDPVAGAGNHYFAAVGYTGDDGADRIIAAVTGTFGLGNC